jgi:hypothetical protein
MSALLSGQIGAFIPGIFSFVIAALLLVALRKVDAIKQNSFRLSPSLVGLLLVFAGIFLLYASEFWYVLTGP